MNPWMQTNGEYDPFAPDTEDELLRQAMSDEDMVGDYSPYGTDNTTPGNTAQILSDKMPVVNGAGGASGAGTMPAVAPSAVLRAMQMPVASNPGGAVQQQQQVASLPQFKSAAYDKLTQHDASIPLLQKPKLWQRIAAGLLGAGSAVAASQATPGVSRPDTGAIGMATQALLNPNRSRDLQNWQVQRQVLKDQLGAEQAYNSNIIRSGQLGETQRRNDMMMDAIRGKNKYYEEKALTDRMKVQNAGNGAARQPTNWTQVELAEYNRLKDSGDPVLMDQAKQMYDRAMQMQYDKGIPAAQRVEVVGRMYELMQTGLDEESARQQAEIEYANAAKIRRGKQNEQTDANVIAAKSQAERNEAQANRLNNPISKPPSSTQVETQRKSAATQAANDAKRAADGDLDQAIAAVEQSNLSDRVKADALDIIRKEKDRKKKSDDDFLNKLVGGGGGGGGGTGGTAKTTAAPKANAPVATPTRLRFDGGRLVPKGK